MCPERSWLALIKYVLVWFTLANSANVIFRSVQMEKYDGSIYANQIVIWRLLNANEGNGLHIDWINVFLNSLVGSQVMGGEIGWEYVSGAEADRLTCKG